MNDLKAGYTSVDEDCKNARIHQRILLKCVSHVQHDYLSSFNQSYNRFVSLPLPTSFLKLPPLWKQGGGDPLGDVHTSDEVFWKII